MSGRSLEVFRSIWQSRLTGQLPRPTSPAEALASRDLSAALEPLLRIPMARESGGLVVPERIVVRHAREFR